MKIQSFVFGLLAALGTVGAQAQSLAAGSSATFNVVGANGAVIVSKTISNLQLPTGTAPFTNCAWLTSSTPHLYVCANPNAFIVMIVEPNFAFVSGTTITVNGLTPSAGTVLTGVTPGAYNNVTGYAFSTNGSAVNVSLAGVRTGLKRIMYYIGGNLVSGPAPAPTPLPAPVPAPVASAASAP